LLQGIKELGFTRPTPIQTEAVPPAMAGRDVLACAMTGSGKTAAFLLPVLHRLLARPRGATRALVLTPTRELAAQVLADLQDLAVHTPISGAAVIGGVGMGPQEHAFRSHVDVIVATPGRLLDHFKQPYGKLPHLEFLVLDEADRMLDMGFLPDIRRVLKHLPPKRQTMFFSATMPPPIQTLTREILHDPVLINLERKAAPAVGITQAIYPVAQELKSALLAALLDRNVMREALVFTRTKHRANRLWEYLEKRGVKVARIHGNRSQGQRTEALDGFKSGRYRVLVATDIAARGIDVEALGHVVNFDVPAMPEDYIHRVGRTARAELTGEAFTFASPEEAEDLRAIERAIGSQLPRVTIPDFDYTAKPTVRFEIPIGERIAQIRARKAEDRARSKAKQARKAAHSAPAASTSGPASGPRPAPAAGQAPSRSVGPRSGPSQRSGGAGRGRRGGGR
jgi:ATP-dependent RNA helicase RhlE